MDATASRPVDKMYLANVPDLIGNMSALAKRVADEPREREYARRLEQLGTELGKQWGEAQKVGLFNNVTQHQIEKHLPKNPPQTPAQLAAWIRGYQTLLDELTRNGDQNHIRYWTNRTTNDLEELLGKMSADGMFQEKALENGSPLPFYPGGNACGTAYPDRRGGYGFPPAHSDRHGCGPSSCGPSPWSGRCGYSSPRIEDAFDKLFRHVDDIYSRLEVLRRCLSMLNDLYGNRGINRCCSNISFGIGANGGCQRPMMISFRA